MKKIVFVSFIVLVSFLLFFNASCEDNSAESKQTEETDKLEEEVFRQIGMPNIVNFFMLKTLKMIQELSDNPKLETYCYLFSEYNGKLYFLTRSVGFGIPFSAQYTNSVKVKNFWGTRIPIPQRDPNMLYMPTSSDATWLVNFHYKTGKIDVAYCEPKILVWPYPLPHAVYPDIIGMRYKDLLNLVEKE